MVKQKPAEDSAASVQPATSTNVPDIFQTEPGQEPTYTLPKRPAMTLEHFRSEYQFVEKEPFRIHIREYKPVITCAQTKQYVKARLPILVWLKEYQWKKDIIPDIVGGITLGILRIPQAMAYALLAKVLPVYGLYTCFFSCLIYTILGSSKHVSVGAFSVLCLMLGNIVEKHFPKPTDKKARYDIVLDFAQKLEIVTEKSKIELLSAMCFVVGIMHILLAILKLGSLSVLMSETLVSGFTTGAACHVFTSQLPLLFGIEIVKANWQYFNIFNTYYEVFRNINDANYITTIISFITLFLLIFTSNYDVGHFKKKTGMPLPVELTIVIVITVVSYFVKLVDYKVAIVGEITPGLPFPSLPKWELMPKIIEESIPVAIVSFVISFSMALIFAKKYKYRVHANQELYALGFSNIFCCLFESFPLASFISCFIILLVLLFVGPSIYYLPKCVLGAIVMAAVQGMFFQVKDLFKAWKMSPLDGLVWIVSFLSVIIFDVTLGLIICISFSLMTIILRTMNIRALKIQFTEPEACLLGVIPDTDTYVDLVKYKSATEIPAIKIFRFNGPIHFANRRYFQSRLHDLVEVTTKLATEERSRRLTVHVTSRTDIRRAVRPSVFFADTCRFIILDCSGWPYIDLSGLTILHELIKDYLEEEITVHLAACQDPVLEMLFHTKFEKKAPTSCIFPRIHDAVLYCMMARKRIMDSA